MKKLLFVALALSGLLHAQNSIGLNINNADVEIRGSVNLNTLTGYADGTTYIFNADYLHTHGDNMTSLGLYGENTFQGIEGLTLAFGIKSVIADDFLAFPLTAKGSYRLPLTDSIPPSYISSTIAFSPTILSFVDAQNYTEFRIEAGMEIISNIHIFTGYRNIDTKYDTYDKTFNDDFYLGMKLSF